MTCYRGFLLGSCRRVAGGRAAALRVPGAGGPGARPRLGGDGGARRRLGQGQGQARELAGCGRRPDGGFRPSRVVVVAKTTRYEFEQQRYRYAELSEEDLKQLVGPGAETPSRRPPCSRPHSPGLAPRSPLASGGRGRERGAGGAPFVQRPRRGAGRPLEAWGGGRGRPSGGLWGSFGPPFTGSRAAAPQEVWLGAGVRALCRELPRPPRSPPPPRESGVRAAGRGGRRGHTPWDSAGPSGSREPFPRGGGAVRPGSGRLF